MGPTVGEDEAEEKKKEKKKKKKKKDKKRKRSRSRSRRRTRSRSRSWRRGGDRRSLSWRKSSRSPARIARRRSRSPMGFRGGGGGGGGFSGGVIRTGSMLANPSSAKSLDDDLDDYFNNPGKKFETDKSAVFRDKPRSPPRYSGFGRRDGSVGAEGIFRDGRGGGG